MCEWMRGNLRETPCGEPVRLNDFGPFAAAGQAVRGGKESVISAERAGAAARWTLSEGHCGAPGGCILFAAADQNAPTLVFHPRVRGRHAVFIGLFGKRAFRFVQPGQAYRYDAFGAYVRLGGETCYTALMTERNEASYEEVYFRTVDFDEETRIEVGNFGLPTFLTGITLVPVSAAPPPARAGKVIGILDFADDVAFARPRDLAGAAAVRRHAEMGFDLIMWKAANGTICEYHTERGVRRNDATPIAELLRDYDPMRQAAAEAKRAGVKLFAWSRLMRDPHRKANNPPPTPFHAAHPGMVQVFKDGAESWQLSFAYPETRRHMISILCEMAATGVDGVFVDLLRHPPVARYDRPLVEAFKARTGLDPREMPGDGPEEWLRFRCEGFTQFLRELRAALDAGNGGARYPLFLRTMDQPWRNLEAGCDVERWMAERLLDGIIFAPHIPTAESHPDHLDLRPYVQMAKGAVGVFGQVWRQSSALQAEALAAELYAQGVDGVALYESNLAVVRSSMRERLWRFGCPELCRAPSGPAASRSPFRPSVAPGPSAR